MTDKTPAASLQENMNVIYEKSRVSWDSTVDDYKPSRSYWAKDNSCDQTTKEDSYEKNKETIDTLKTFAYIKLGEEIMKQTDLSGSLGGNGTKIQLTKIRDGELFAFEEGGQLHITNNETDRGTNKIMQWDQVAVWIGGKKMNEKWNDQQMMKEIKWHLPRVYAIKLETGGPELKVLITDNKELVDQCKKEGWKALVGTKTEVDFPGIVSSENNVNEK